MSVLFAGNGADSFDVFGDAEENTGGYDTNWVLQSLRVSNDSTTNINYAIGTGWSAASEVWAHFQVSPYGAGHMIHLLDNTDTPMFRFRSSSGGTVKMEYLSALNTWTQIGSDVTLPDSSATFDIYLKTGASGEAILFVNQVERTSGTASITYPSDPANIKLVCTAGFYNYFSQVIVADESTIGWRLKQGRMTGAGAHTDFIGDYSGVDESRLSDADFINTSTANDIETFTTSLDSLTGYIPQAVIVAARARRGSTGPQNLQLALRASGVDDFSPTKALGLGYAAYEHIWETNPATSAAFLNSQISTLQPGVKAIA